ncbi:Arylsulfatase A [Microlunatus soli]|uniref:Arylsulfatase A n=1 Tax=Microlunatus soli TaxID=630515 RepID=A0A1H1ZIH9_9ACTN|nr:Arylsulfatase A [Microlunatus soli]
MTFNDEHRGRPNVIWFVVDQMRAQATGYAGDPNLHTPHLDRLAAEGHTFTSAVAGAPLCCPARGSLLTGRYPRFSGVAGHEHPMPVGTPTIASELSTAGYRTAYFGKWHLDGRRPELAATAGYDDSPRWRIIPAERRGGFADWWAYENNNRPFDCLLHTDSGQTPDGVDVLRSVDGMEQFRAPGYETDALTDLAIDWMRRRERDQPFFAVISAQPPHDPYVAPAECMARHTPAGISLRPNVPPSRAVRDRARRDLAGYYAAIERIDHNLGRLRCELDRLGIADNTYIVFLSDHGDMHGSHGQWRKTSPWEESVRVPLIIGGPSREHQSAHRVETLINQVDIAPTTLGICGVDVPDRMQGTDFSAVISNQAPAPPSTYIGIPVPTGHGSSIDQPWSGVITADGWKYVCLEDRPWLMFDLTDDPYELANHAQDPAYHAQRADLHALVQDTESALVGGHVDPTTQEG